MLVIIRSMLNFAKGTFEGSILRAFIFEIFDSYVSDVAPVDCLWRQPHHLPHRFCICSDMTSNSFVFDGFIFASIQSIRERLLLANQRPPLRQDNQSNVGSYNMRRCALVKNLAFRNLRFLFDSLVVSKT